ncbi:MAG: hypothetical protein IT546_00930 [Caulobacteraceae bacterium]|nr:hypothetical protein [Caulobacteraceae bacterium]
MIFRFELYAKGEAVDRVVDTATPDRLMGRARRLLQRCRACDEIRVIVGGRQVLVLRKRASGVIEPAPKPGPA